MNINNELHSIIDRSTHELLNKLIIRTGLSEKHPKLCSLIHEYCCQNGKKIRSTLFLLSYLQLNRSACKNLFIGAASLELLHLFALIQDDVIDNSDMRRGTLSLHKVIESSGHISCKKAQDLAIIFSDILYSAAIEAFLQIEEDAEKKQHALKIILDAAVHTGSGQFLELIYSSEKFEEITLENIYEIYDLKTARYTFCGPMIAGAVLAGCEFYQIELLNQVGTYLGRAYQISDDILDYTNLCSDSGFPSDIVEQRKTILLWHLTTYGGPDAQTAIEAAFRDCTIVPVSTLIDCFHKYGSFDFAFQEMNSNYHKALDLLSLCTLRSGSNRMFDFIVDLFSAVKKECCI
jgi:geranylgeranyl pyrophosphate synthase